MNLPEFSVNRRVTVLMMILIIAVIGVVMVTTLGQDLMPDIEFPLITVSTRYEGVAPEDIEQTITRPVEMAVSGTKGVKSVRSFSEEGLSIVVAEFTWGTDPDVAAQDVREQLDMMLLFLPDGAEDPSVIKFDPGQMPVMVYGVTGMEDTAALQEYLYDVVAPLIERKDGVAMAAPIGGLAREIRVSLHLDKLEAFSISPQEVVRALRFENVNVSGGHIMRGPDEHIIRTMGEFRSVEEIGETIVALRNGNPITVSELATVEDAHEEVRSYVRMNGEDAVMLVVMKQAGANTVKVSDEVEKVVKGLKLPEGVTFLAIMDQAEFIRKLVNMTVWDALLGGALAVIFIFVFLRSLRPTFVIFLAIPLSILTTFIGFYFADYTFNLITLMGLGLGVGMLVDNAVVVIENIYRHMEMGEDRKTAAARGASEVMTAITASTLTTIAVFLPMVLIGGLMSKFARPLALTLTLALLASLFVAVTLVPMVASVIFRARTKEEVEREREVTVTFLGKIGRVLKMPWLLLVGLLVALGKPLGVMGLYLQRKYRAAVATTVDRPGLVLGTVGAALGIAALAALRVPSEFIPTGDDPMMVLHGSLPVGTSLEDTNRVVAEIESYVSGLPESRLVMAQVGPGSRGIRERRGSMGVGARDVNEAMVMLRMKDLAERDRRSPEIQEDLREHFPKIGDKSPFYFSDMHMISASGDTSAFTLEIFGDEFPVLKRLGQMALERLSGVKGLRGLRLSVEEGKSEVRFRPDRVRASQWGLGVAQIASAAKTAVLGEVATQARLDGDDVYVRVLLREEDRESLDALRRLPVLSPLGVHVPLSSVTDLSFPKGPLVITRENRTRKVTVTGQIAGRALGDLIADAGKALEGMPRPPGYFTEFGGSYLDMQETLSAIGWAFLASAILVYMVMAALFESLSQPLVVMITVPLAGIGVVTGLTAFGMSISLVSGLGLVILVGIVVNNAIVMIDRINQLRRSGMEIRQAVIDGATGRLRPVLITSFTTILGVLPMALSRSEGAEMRSPMGVAVSFGLFFSMFLTLFVIPTVYARSCIWADAAGVLFARIVRGEKPPADS